MTATEEVVIAVDRLSVRIGTGAHAITPVDGVSFEVRRGECLGLVGESGSGKSLLLRSLVGLLPVDAAVHADSMRFVSDGSALEPYSPPRVRGAGIAMVFQEPLRALNPTMRVGDLIAEGARLHLRLSRSDARRRAVDLLAEVGVPDPGRRARDWPWQLSGGLRQRVMIAMALSSEPALLLCDEPTTALDVSVQDQVLRLLDRLRRERGLSILLVSHDLAVVSQIAHRVAVMYAGEIVETGSTPRLLAAPRHPYTMALLRCVPAVDRPTARLVAIAGAPPDPHEVVAGCRFAARCEHVQELCLREHPAWVPLGHVDGGACHRLTAMGSA
jgi:oligopeptide/dipeptide ABC transporter ATP-binding protein